MRRWSAPRALQVQLEGETPCSPELRVAAQDLRGQVQAQGLPGCAVLLRCLTSALAVPAAHERSFALRDAPLLAMWCGLLAQSLECGAADDTIDLLLTLLGEVETAPRLQASARARLAAALRLELDPPQAPGERAVAPGREAASTAPDDAARLRTSPDAADLAAQPSAVAALDADPAGHRPEDAAQELPSDGADDESMPLLPGSMPPRESEGFMPGHEASVAVGALETTPARPARTSPAPGTAPAMDVDADAFIHTLAEPGPEPGSDAGTVADTVAIDTESGGFDAPAPPAIGQDVAHDIVGMVASADATGVDESGFAAADAPCATAQIAPGSAVQDAAAVHDETPPANAAAALWISKEELAVTCAALGEQILPLALEVAGRDPGPELDAGLADLAYHFSLVANAMHMLGLPVLAELLAMPEARHATASFDADTAVTLAAAALAYLERPDPAAAADLAGIGAGIGLSDDAWGLRLSEEAARIVVGVDPALRAARKRHAEPADVELRTASDVLPNVLESMLRELPGNAERLGVTLRALSDGRGAEAIDEARRIAHTLKGDANTVGCAGLAHLAHSLEDILIELLRRPEQIDPALAAFLLESADIVEECADHLLGRGPAPASLLGIYQQCLDWANALLDGEAQPSGNEDRVPMEPAHAATRNEAAAESGVSGESRGAAALAVDAALLDELQRLAGEILILGRQIDRRIATLAEAQRALVVENGNERGLAAQLDDLVALRGAALQSTQLAAPSRLDALELDQYNELHTVSRRIIETQADSTELLRRVESVLLDLDPLRVQQERLGDELQRAVDRTRTVPFSRVSARLQRVVRQTARSLGKDVVLQIDGEDCGLDAELLDRLVEPLSHLLRNAVDHGIEDAAARIAAGKPAAGTLRISVRLGGDSARIAVSDDGRGMDEGAIRRKAERLGWLDPEAVIARETLLRMVLQPGFSTRDDVSQISGRGVGMDVVHQRVRQLRGTLTLASQADAGTEVVLRLPISRTLADVVVASGHGVVMAVVASHLDRVCAIAAGDIERDEHGVLHAQVEGRRMRLHTIESLFQQSGPQSLPGASACLGLVLAEDADGVAQVLSVREVTESTRAVIKPISDLLPTLPGVRGMTQLGDGRIAPVCDLPVLLDRLGAQAPYALDPTIDAAEASPYIVIADDSLSVRRALEQLFEDAGFRVGAARDGMEAVGLIQQQRPTAVIVDLEMPRMNGLEVCRLLRNRDDTRATPVVMITSRASDKYRTMAQEAGVDLVLGKPYAEDDLLDRVRELISASESGARATAR